MHAARSLVARLLFALVNRPLTPHRENAS